MRSARRAGPTSATTTRLVDHLQQGGTQRSSLRPSRPDPVRPPLLLSSAQTGHRSAGGGRGGRGGSAAGVLLLHDHVDRQARGDREAPQRIGERRVHLHDVIVGVGEQLPQPGPLLGDRGDLPATRVQHGEVLGAPVPRPHLTERPAARVGQPEARFAEAELLGDRAEHDAAGLPDRADPAEPRLVEHQLRLAVRVDEVQGDRQCHVQVAEQPQQERERCLPGLLHGADGPAVLVVDVVFVPQLDQLELLVHHEHRLGEQRAGALLGLVHRGLLPRRAGGMPHATGSLQRKDPVGAGQNRPCERPPSTGTSVPVTYDALLEQRNATTSPTSRGWPKRRAGMAAISSGCTSPAWSTPDLAVAIHPGAIELTVIPVAASSVARVFIYPTTPGRTALESTRSRIGSRTEVDAIRTMRAWSLRRRCGSARLTSRTIGSSSNSTAAWSWPASRVAAEPGGGPPPLAITMSRPP